MYYGVFVTSGNTKLLDLILHYEELVDCTTLHKLAERSALNLYHGEHSACNVSGHTIYRVDLSNAFIP